MFQSRVLCAFAVFLLALSWCPVPLAAQSGNGIVQGTVLDATKAAIPAATVTLKNTATGVTRTTQSSGVGIYYFGSVPPGPYALSVEAQGFKRWSGTLIVEVGQTVSVNPTMEVGSVEATIEVTGAAPVVSTEGMQVSDVKDALRIQQLPLNGRDVRNLFNLTPGVEGGGVPRVNGMKVGSTDMLLDGISLVDRFGGGLRGGVSPGLDTIQEYRIETSGSGAEYSRPATVTLVTKSGTNELHGSAFWTHRNNFGGLRARQRQDTGDAAQLIRNEFGVSAGGPVIRNKTFWFAAYEGTRDRQARFARTQVATPAIWGGDFSSAIDNNSDPITIYNPFSTQVDGTRVPFANNVIPTNLISPFAETMRGVSPDPAGPNAGGNPWIEPNFEAFYPNQSNIDTLTLKGDHVFSERDSLSGRFTRTRFTNKLFGGRFGFPRPGSTDAGGTGLTDARIYSSFVRWNRVFSPTFLNELQVSNNRAPKASGTLANEAPWADRLGLPNPFSVTGWPTICTDSPFYYFGCWDGDNRKDENLTAYQLEDNVTWIKGKHTMKFGGKVRYEYNNIRELQQSQGSHSFYGDWTAQYDPANDNIVSRTGSGFASLLLGTPTFLSNQFNRGFFYFEQQEYGLYFQDSWKVSPRLTLDLGLRWDKWTAYEEKFNRLVNVDLSNFANQFQVVTPQNVRMEDLPGIPPAVLQSWANRGLTWTTADSISGFPSNLIQGDHNNFGPRVGVAYRVSDKWILRGGYGEYFWTMPLSQILQTSRTNPPLNLRFSNSIGSLQGADPFHAARSVPSEDEFVGKAVVPTEGVVTLSSNSQSMMPWDARNWSDNRMQQWNFTIERELMKETALRLSYIGNHGRDLEQRYSINGIESEWNYQARTGEARPSNSKFRRVNPDWAFRAANHSGFSNAHSLQAEVERRYSNGLAFQWFYTFTRALTTNDTGGFTSGNGNINSTSGSIEVPESIQILGAPSLSYKDRQRLGYYNSGEVPAHRVRWNGIYDLPFGRGKKYGGSVSRGLDALIGGWQLAFIGEWRGGQWSSVSSGRYLFGDPTLDADERLEMTIFGRRQRLWFRGDFDPSLASNVDAARLEQLVPADRSQRVLKPVGSNFDNRIPQVLADGTVRLTSITDNVNWNARSFFRGPGFWNQDISVFKNFQITERVKTRFTADFFNAFNHPVDVDPNSTTGLQDLSRQSNEPRIIQFSLRVEF